MRRGSRRFEWGVCGVWFWSEEGGFVVWKTLKLWIFPRFFFLICFAFLFCVCWFPFPEELLFPGRNMPI